MGVRLLLQSFHIMCTSVARFLPENSLRVSGFLRGLVRFSSARCFSELMIHRKTNQEQRIRHGGPQFHNALGIRRSKTSDQKILLEHMLTIIISIRFAVLLVCHNSALL